MMNTSERHIGIWNRIHGSQPVRAYENGDNYSAVYNEIPFVFTDFELNENGLFQTKEEILEYISKREEYEKAHKPYTLEVGDFTIFEVYEVIL